MTIAQTFKFLIDHPLNRDHRLRALAGFLKWQVGSRLVPGPVIFEWIEGTKVIVRPGETGLTGSVYSGLQELPEMAYLLHVLDSDDLVVDAGANVGSFTILAGGVRGARVVSVEPIPSTFDRLRRNVLLNELGDRVRLFNLGLSDKVGKLVFTAGRNSTNHVVTDDTTDSDTVEVDVLPLDDVLDGDVPFLIKIDVEGFESPLLAGAGSTLANENLQSVIMELNDSGSRYGFEDDEILDVMRDFGFRPYTYEPVARILSEIDGKNDETQNTIFIRDLDVVRKRISQAPVIAAGLGRI